MVDQDIRAIKVNNSVPETKNNQEISGGENYRLMAQRDTKNQPGPPQGGPDAFEQGIKILRNVISDDMSLSPGEKTKALKRLDDFQISPASERPDQASMEFKEFTDQLNRGGLKSGLNIMNRTVTVDLGNSVKVVVPFDKFGIGFKAEL